MAKPKATITITLPPWDGKSNKYAWRKEIIRRLGERQDEGKLTSLKSSKIEVDALVHRSRPERAQKVRTSTTC